MLEQLPFSIYFGWISAAGIVIISIPLYTAGREGFGLFDSMDEMQPYYYSYIAIILA